MKDVSNAVAYALLLPELMKAGREVGYAIAAHGSLSRDLDIVAIPWTGDAVSAERLIMHLMAKVNGRLRNSSQRKKNADGTDGEWEPIHAAAPNRKPHGRIAWSVYVGREFDSLYLDISVMPLAPDADVKNDGGDFPKPDHHPASVDAYARTEDYR